MNPITVFLTIACLVVGAVLGARGYFVPAAALLVVAVVIALRSEDGEHLAEIRYPARRQIARREGARPLPVHSGHRQRRGRH
jgi:hypothetical protein